MKLIENGLIPVYETEKGNAAVNARELHSGLKVGRDFSNWIKDKFDKYGFIEGQDYSPFLANRSDGLAGKPKTEYALTLDCAKEIAMVENNDQGRLVRKYFIEVEKKHNTLPTNIDAILNNPDVVIGILSAYKEEKAKNAELLPKAQFYDAVTGSKDAIDIGTVAHVLNFSKGRTTLFRILRENEILKSDNLPYQEYRDRGYFRVIESTYTNNSGTHANYKTVVYQKGIDYIRKLLIKQGYMKETA